MRKSRSKQRVLAPQMRKGVRSTCQEHVDGIPKEKKTKSSQKVQSLILKIKSWSDSRISM